VSLADANALRSRIKELIIRSLNLEGLTPDRIGDEQRLFSDGLGLDSVDALELVVALEKEFGISVKSHEIDRKHFESVAALAELVEKCRETPPPGLPNG
jgi:acyl carrier protein